MSYSFASMKMENIDKSILDNEFECVFDDGDASVYYESKKTYVHDVDDDLKFSYKYIICVEDIRAFGGEDDAPISVALYLVPTFDCWNEKDKKGIVDFIGAESIEDVNLYDAVMGYGNNVLVADDIFKSLGNYTIDCEETMNLVHTCANCVQFIDRMRGFYLDKPQNRIGTTGWDIIKHTIDNSYDVLKATFDRYEKNKAE